jgi:hypothetical protein
MRTRRETGRVTSGMLAMTEPVNTARDLRGAVAVVAMVAAVAARV